MQIPGAPIRGQDRGLGMGISSSTIITKDKPGPRTPLPGPLAYPSRKGSHAGQGLLQEV